MSNLINNIIPTEKAATSSVSTSTADQTTKDKPSLFDSLLSTGSTTEETKVSTEIKQEIKENKADISTVVKSEEVKLGEVTADKLNNEELDLSEEVDNKGQKVTGTSSLLDRLILEAKNSAKEIVDVDKQVGIPVLKDLKSEEIAALNTKEEIKTNIETKEVKTQEVAVVSTEEAKVIDKSNIEQPELTEKVDNKVQKEAGTTTLLDRLILEAKNSNKEVVPDANKEVANLNDDIQVIKEQIKVSTELKSEETVVETKSEETVVETKSEEIKVDDKKTEIKNIKKDISNLLEKIDTKAEENVSVINNETKTVKDILKKTDTTSLLANTLIESNNILVDNSSTKIITDSSISVDNKSTNIDLNINNQSSTGKVIEDANVIELEKIDTKKDVKTSLMDQLIQKNSEKLVVDNINGISEDLNTPLKDVVAKDIISNIYLGSQKNKITNQNLFNKNEAISLLKDGNSIQAVKASAEMLDLGLESVNVVEDIGLDNLDIKKSNIDLLNKKNLIDNLLLKNDIRGEEVKDLITKSVEASKALIDNTLTVADDAIVNVNSPLSYNIQSRIIGAKQQMSAMMSDIAKQMYENYKPPVTAFKINLNPLDLGSIAILMKNDKHNGLTISMNVSNNVTLDTLIENQNILRNSLNKTFDENTKFNLDFSSSNQNNNSNQSSNTGQGNNRRFEQQMDTRSILELQEENKDREEKVIDYM